ncbi:hypothetical protein [Photorhabdus bodei]|uniref:hypothetical protein n=1 Tax=Photorhabdus bodei TaxID=2029681 RepID=UPI003A7F4304
MNRCLRRYGQKVEIGDRLVSLSGFRTMFGIEEKYLQFRDSNKFILKPTTKELNQKSNLRWS